MKILKDILFLIGDTKKHLVKIVFFILAMELSRIISNEFFVRLLNNVVETSTIVWSFFLWWLGISLLNWWLDGGADYFIVKLLVDVEYLIPMKSLKHLVTLSMNFFSDNGTGKIAKKIEQGADGLSSLLESFCWEVISSTLQVTVTTIYLFIVFKQWGFVLLGTAGIFVVLTIILDKLKRELRKSRYDLYEICGHLLFQIMQNIAIVKAFGKEKDEVTNYDKNRSEIRKLSLKEFRYEVWFNILRGSLVSVAISSIFYLGVGAVATGSIKVGSIVGAINLATAALFSLFRLTRILVRFMDNYEAISRTVDFLKETPEIVDAQDAQDVFNLHGDVVFDHVSFSYKNGDAADKECLKDISFAIPAGKTVAIVGPSGSGKTTLINLLLRFMDPTSGVIRVGGYDIKNLKQQSYRNNLSIVLQDSLLFDRTVGENVAEGVTSPDELAIWNVLDKSYASEFVRNMSNGLDTMIGEHGVKLSGGQRQRIGIAAALIRDPTILILDEATSSLDTQSEKYIQRALRDLQERGDTTIFVIAHRLSTIREADIILVLDKGELVQIGSHKKLIKDSEGLYAQMVGIQSM